MKTLTSILIFMAVSLTALAQDQVSKNIDPNPVNVLKHRLDSIVVMACPVLESNGLAPWEKIRYFYDFTGIQSSEVYAQWNANLAVWVNNTKTDYYYNPGGSVAKTIMYVWEPTSAEWRDALKKEFTYDSYNNVLSEIEYAGGDPIIPWMPQHKSEYTWNTYNKMLSKVMSVYYVDEASWIPEYKYENFFHPNGYLVRQTESVWKRSSASWEFAYQHEYSYGPGWVLAVKSEFGWNDVKALWENRYKTNYAYNFINKIESLTRQWWNAESMQWQAISMQEFIYDFAGNQVRETASYWDHFAATWRNTSRTICEYDLAITHDDLISPNNMGIYAYTSRNMMTDLTHYRSINNNWVADYQFAYYYHPFGVAGIEEPGIGTVGVFPNPATSSLAFTWNDLSKEKILEVYDPGGKLILRKSIYENINIEISALPEGGYFYRLYDKKLLPLSGKFMVIR